MENYLDALPTGLGPEFMDAAGTFLSYASAYDLNDPKIDLKLRHTFQVVDACHYLGISLKLSGDDLFIACLIGLLHDIGRFEQLTRFHSFDDSLLPHAKLSVELLFDRGLIRNYLPERLSSYETFIRDAIDYHGVFKLPEGLSGNTRLFSRLIRDADKLDNFRVKAYDSMEAMLDISEEELNKETLSDYAYSTFTKREPLLNSLRETHLDMWLSYIGYLFDLNFPASFRYLQEKGYVDVILRRADPIQPAVKKQWDEICAMTHAYLVEHQ